MPEIDRGGVPIHYEVHGPTDRNAPAMLLSHGYGATCRMWDGQVAAFADRYRLILWDMRGHGQSGDPADPALYSHALSVGDMAAVLDACGEAGPVVVGGLSLGGVFSLAFYQTCPERVSALLLCDTGPGFRNPEARQQWNERAERRARDIEARGIGDPVGGAETRLGRHRSARGLAGAARGMLTQPDGSLIGSLPQIAVPTPRHRRQRRPEFPRRRGLHGRENPWRAEGRHRRRRPFRQPRPAGSLQPRRRRLSGGVAAHGLTSTLN
jgi:pimeloyl-ACP methyl ester carboxylesterase